MCLHVHVVTNNNYIPHVSIHGILNSVNMQLPHVHVHRNTTHSFLDKCGNVGRNKHGRREGIIKKREKSAGREEGILLLCNHNVPYS